MELIAICDCWEISLDWVIIQNKKVGVAAGVGAGVGTRGGAGVGGGGYEEVESPMKAHILDSAKFQFLCHIYNALSPWVQGVHV